MVFELFKQTLRLRFLGWRNIPLLGSVRPRVVVLDGERCVIRVPLRRWTRNDLASDQRLMEPIQVMAAVKTAEGFEPVARFILELSLKQFH